VNLTTQDSKEILSAVQTLAKIQINQNLETYRERLFKVYLVKETVTTILSWRISLTL